MGGEDVQSSEYGNESEGRLEHMCHRSGGSAVHRSAASDSWL